MRRSSSGENIVVLAVPKEFSGCSASDGPTTAIFLALHYLADLFQQFVELKRLLNKSSQALNRKLVDRVLLGVSTGENDTHIRANAPHFSKGFLAIHPWHRQIQQHSDNLI